MKRYGFDDLFVGMSAQFKRKIVGEMIDSFAQVSGDSNPLHIDSDYARRSGFKDQIAHGMLCSSLFSELVGVHLPGENCLLTDISVVFSKPVFIDDEVIVDGSITQLSPAFKSAKIDATITNINSEVCIRAKIGVVVR
jgi:3-hydroxybutyryl-CoA dehydratase